MQKSKYDMWVIELNLDADFASSASWHVDQLRRVIDTNLEIAHTNQETNRWAIVGLSSNDMHEAIQMAEMLRANLCAIHGKTPINIIDN
jgi:hypothetical protein